MSIAFENESLATRFANWMKSDETLPETATNLALDLRDGVVSVVKSTVAGAIDTVNLSYWAAMDASKGPLYEMSKQAAALPVFRTAAGDTHAPLQELPAGHEFPVLRMPMVQAIGQLPEDATLAQKLAPLGTQWSQVVVVGLAVDGLAGLPVKAVAREAVGLARGALTPLRAGPALELAEAPAGTVVTRGGTKATAAAPEGVQLNFVQNAPGRDARSAPGRGGHRIDRNQTPQQLLQGETVALVSAKAPYRQLYVRLKSVLLRTTGKDEAPPLLAQFTKLEDDLVAAQVRVESLRNGTATAPSLGGSVSQEQQGIMQAMQSQIAAASDRRINYMRLGWEPRQSSVTGQDQVFQLKLKLERTKAGLGER